MTNTSVAEKYSAKIKHTAAGKAPVQAQPGGKRFGTLVLFDTSTSTKVAFKGNAPDIDTINAATVPLLKAFRDAPRSTPLGKVKKNIDLAIVAYNTEVTTVLDWTAADALPLALPTLQAGGFTSSGKALMHALRMAKDYQTHLRSQRMPIGLINILHFTDGMPTDMMPGDEMWRKVQQAYEITTQPTQGLATTEGAERAANIVHLVTPNGCDPDFYSNATSPGNGPKQGLERLSALTGPKSVHTVDAGLRLVDTLVELVSGIVIKTSVFGKSGTDAAKDTLDNLKNGKDNTEEDTPID